MMPINWMQMFWLHFRQNIWSCVHCCCSPSVWEPKKKKRNKSDGPRGTPSFYRVRAQQEILAGSRFHFRPIYNLIFIIILESDSHLKCWNIFKKTSYMFFCQDPNAETRKSPRTLWGNTGQSGDTWAHSWTESADQPGEAKKNTARDEGPSN